MGLKLWVNLWSSPQHTQMVPKWPLTGQLARTAFGNARARAAQCAKMFQFSPGTDSDGFGLLKTGKKK